MRDVQNDVPLLANTSWEMFKMIQQMLGFEILYTMYHCQI